MKERVAEKMAAYIKSIIIHGDVELLIGGQFIIAPDAKIQSANCMVISAMCGGTLNAMCGGTLNNMWGGTLNDMRGGTLNDMWGGTLNRILKCFDGLLKKVHRAATVVKDERE